MNRLERLHAITTTLQSKRIVKADEMAKKFDVSLRTIYRDIRALEAGGMPIGAEAGIGYFLIEGYHLPPIMFTKEEGRALLMAAKLMEKVSDPSVIAPIQAALTKVRAVLNTEKKEDLQDLEERIIVNPFPENNPAPANAVLDKVKEAIVQKKVLEMDYFSNYTGQTAKRKVESIGLTFYGNHWHLIAFCQFRNDYRDFRTDRISGISLLNERFQPFKHPSLKEYVDKMITQHELHRVVIHVHQSIHRYLADSKYSMGLIQEEQKGDTWTMTFATMSLEYFSRWLLIMLDKVEVIEPQELKDKIQIYMQVLIKHYTWDTGL